MTREIEGQIESMQRVIGAKSYPDILIGPHCDSPYTCALHDQCWSFLPDASIFSLYRGGAKCFWLLQQGIQKLADIPADVALTEYQVIQRSTLLAGQPHIDRPALAEFLGQFEYPSATWILKPLAQPSRCLTASAPTSRCHFNTPCILSAAPDAKPDHRPLFGHRHCGPASGIHAPTSCRPAGYRLGGDLQRQL